MPQKELQRSFTRHKKKTFFHPQSMKFVQLSEVSRVSLLLSISLTGVLV